MHGARPAILDAVQDLPTPPSGFRRAAAVSLLGVSRGGDRLWTAAFARCELRVLAQNIAAGVLIGPVRSASMASSAQSIEDAYRVILDHVLSAAPMPNVISARVLDEEQSCADLLWRLALAIDGRATVSAERGGLRIDIFRPGRRGELAAAISAGRRVGALRLTIRNLGTLRRGQDSSTLLVLARDVRRPIGENKTSITVEFSEATDLEVQRHPNRFGLPLYSSAVAPDVRRQFVGRVNGEVIFRMVLNFSAPALDRLVLPSFAASLTTPVALVSQCATEPSFRGLGVYPAALHWLAEWAAAGSVQTLVLLIDSKNEASLRGAARAGFVRIGEVKAQR